MTRKPPDYARRQRSPLFTPRAARRGGSGGIVRAARLAAAPTPDPRFLRLSSAVRREPDDHAARGAVPWGHLRPLRHGHRRGTRKISVFSCCRRSARPCPARSTHWPRRPVSDATRDRITRAARRQSGYYPVLVAEGLSWRQFALLNVLAPANPRHADGPLRLSPLQSCPAHGPRGRLCRHGRQGRGQRRPGHAASGLPHRDAPGSRRPSTASSGEARAPSNTRSTCMAAWSASSARGRARRGRDIVLTIDHHLQTVALDRIKDHRVASIVVHRRGDRRHSRHGVHADLRSQR